MNLMKNLASSPLSVVDEQDDDPCHSGSPGNVAEAEM